MSDAVLEWTVKVTLYLLIGFSVLTWAVVVAKARQSLRSRRSNRAFVAAFGRSVTLPAAEDVDKQRGPAARVAQSALRAIDEAGALAEGGGRVDAAVRREYIERSLHEQVQNERRTFEAGLAVLASVGTTSPFVGLFGTVWGIIHALRRIGATGSASLEVVAGPIGEALIATGIGIAVAVPAVLAYNVFVRRGKAQHAELEHLASTFLRLAARSQLAVVTSGAPAPAATARAERKVSLATAEAI